MPFPVPEPYVWDSSFQVFYFALDDEHRAIFEGLFNCTNDNSPSNLQILYLVTANHFADEEGYMQRAGYAGYGSHKGAHEGFLAKLRTLSAPVSKDDLNFAKNWLVQHIKSIDFKYKQKL